MHFQFKVFNFIKINSIYSTFKFVQILVLFSKYFRSLASHFFLPLFSSCVCGALSDIDFSKTVIGILSECLNFFWGYRLFLLGFFVQDPDFIHICTVLGGCSIDLLRWLINFLLPVLDSEAWVRIVLIAVLVAPDVLLFGGLRLFLNFRSFQGHSVVIFVLPNIYLFRN